MHKALCWVGNTRKSPAPTELTVKLKKVYKGKRILQGSLH